jgi:hypothetical protein
MKTTKQAKLAMNRGKSRIWLESAMLADLGYRRHDPIQINYAADAGRIYIHHCDSTDPEALQVAGRARNGKQISIIDINNVQLSDMVAAAGSPDHATVTYTRDLITIEVGAPAAAKRTMTADYLQAPAPVATAEYLGL